MTNVVYAQAECGGGDHLLDRQRMPRRAEDNEARPGRNSRAPPLSAAVF